MVLGKRILHLKAWSGFRPDMSEGAWQHSPCLFAVISIRCCQNSSSWVHPDEER